jgi:hypothetical protein
MITSTAAQAIIVWRICPHCGALCPQLERISIIYRFSRLCCTPSTRKRANTSPPENRALGSE